MPNMFSQKKNVNQNITETHLPAVRMAITKNTTNAGEEWRKGALIHWECKLVQPLWKTVWRLLKK
jgi:hypothetical protein